MDRPFWQTPPAHRPSWMTFSNPGCEAPGGPEAIQPVDVLKPVWRIAAVIRAGGWRIAAAGEFHAVSVRMNARKAGHIRGRLTFQLLRLGPEHHRPEVSGLARGFGGDGWHVRIV